MKPIEVQPVMLMYAFRYALGRRSYCVGDVSDTLIAYADQLPTDWREQIVRDITDAIDEGRAGMQMDVIRWENLRAVMRAAMEDGPEVPVPAHMLMDYGWNVPAPATQDEVEAELRRALMHVAANDSFEGTITWTMPYPPEEPWLEGADFGLIARYRVGNRDGQGGVHVFTKSRP